MESESDSEVEEVYAVYDRYILDHYGTYYQTYGGGPEGGYFLTNKNWYTVSRNWETPWEMKPCEPKKYTPEDWRIGRVAQIE